jgi:hypothetical protein
MFPVSDLTAKGMLVYQTDGAEGFYYYDGFVWTHLASDKSSWSIAGNSGTVAGTNFLGTTDNEELSVKTNNTEAIRIKTNQNVGVGLNNPVQKMDVNGNINAASRQ